MYSTVVSEEYVYNRMLSITPTHNGKKFKRQNIELRVDDKIK